MFLLRDTKIWMRILASLAVPVLTGMAYCGLLLFDSWQKASTMGQLSDLLRLAPNVSAVVHHLQNERGTSAIYIGAKGALFVDRLPEQWKETNTALNTLQSSLNGFDLSGFGGGLAAKMETAREALAGLREKRDLVKALKLSVGQMAGYYTTTIAKLLAVIEGTVPLSSDAGITRHLVGYVSLLEGKERAGQERTLGGEGFGSGEFTPAMYDKFVSLIAQQKALFLTFDKTEPSNLVAFLHETMRGDVVDEVERMRKIAIAYPWDKDLKGVDASHWFAAVTKKIDLMKSVGDRVETNIQRNAARLSSDADHAFVTLIVVNSILSVLALIVLWIIVSSITSPITAMTRAMATLAGGDKTVEIPGVGRGDEIGGMAEAVQVFKDNMIKAENLAANEAWANKVRDFRQRAMIRMTGSFKDTVSTMLEQVGRSASSMQGTSTDMKKVSDETNQRSITVAAAAEQAAANVEAVAVSAEELSASIDEINRQVAQSSQISSQAVTDAERTNEEVQSLSEAAQKIGEVVSLISDIAEQTNLLALNATIEAARAGDAGKGFAVVASEVKNLANQTAKATDEIAAQIGGVQGATQDAVDAIKGIGVTIARVNEIESAIAAAMEEQGAATQEIARNVEQAASGTQDVSANIASVKLSAEQTLETADGVQAVADEMNVLSGDLRTQIENFLTAIE